MFEACKRLREIVIMKPQEYGVMRTSAVLPNHPRAPLPLIDNLVRRFIRELRAKYGDSPSMEQRREIQAIVKDEVGLMRPVLLQVLGNRPV